MRNAPHSAEGMSMAEASRLGSVVALRAPADHPVVSSGIDEEGDVGEGYVAEVVQIPDHLDRVRELDAGDFEVSC